MSRRLSNPNDTGDNQRLITFALLAMAVFLFMPSLFNPPQQPPQEQAEAADEETEDDNEVAGPDAKDEGEEAADEDAALAAPVEADPEAPLRRVSLGSLDPASPYRMLVTLTNEGAGVERVELSSPEYLDLHPRGGYLGALALEEVEGGLKVNSVGTGTPVDGQLEVGDVITEVAIGENASPVETVEQYTQFMMESAAGNELLLKVNRSGQELPVKVTLVRKPLAVMRPESENILMHQESLPDEYEDIPSYRVRFDRVDRYDAKDEEIEVANALLAEETWVVESSDEQSAVFRKRLPELKLEVVKRFILAATPAEELQDENYPAYDFQLEIEIRNLGAEKRDVAYVLEGPNGLPIEGFWYANKIGRSWSGHGLRDLISQYAGSSTVYQHGVAEIGEGDETDTEIASRESSLAFIGIEGQYFMSCVIPEKPLDEKIFALQRGVLATAKLSDETPARFNNPTFIAIREPVELAAAGEEGDAMVDSLRVFAGPKKPELLEFYNAGDNIDQSLGKVVYYGWFGPIARIMLLVLHIFYSVVQNYGIAIILLTVLVRGCLFPLSRKQALNMVKMQELKPEMDRIAAKYKENMEQRAKAQQELFKKNNYNPLGGCWLMFLQLPIFIGLYRALAVDIELRQAPLISDSIRFCSNLAAPDMFIDWSGLWWQSFNNGQGIFALGPYFNLLPILTIVLFLAQQKMFMPPATTPEAQMQQKVMKYVMVFFGFMFFKVPSGLCIYFIASSLWGICERKLLPKPTPAVATTDTAFSKPSGPSGGKTSGRPKQTGGGKKKKRKKK